MYLFTHRVIIVQPLLIALPMDSIPLSLRSTWNDIEKLKAACHLYTLRSSFEFTTKYCDARRYAITCKDKSIEDASPCP